MADIQALLDELLTTREVAEMFDRTVGDVQYAIKTGKITAYKFGGYFHVIHRSDLPKEWPTRKRG